MIGGAEHSVKLLAEGFNTRQTDVRPAGSVSTAMQLVAVIFQLQSLQQFGGVSATHLDWTMVPYVRKSFWKHFDEGIKYCEDDSATLETIKEYYDDYINNIDLAIEHPIIGNMDLRVRYPSAYQFALDMTKKEIHQAVEGLYHNLR